MFQTINQIYITIYSHILPLYHYHNIIYIYIKYIEFTHIKIIYYGTTYI